MDEYLYIDKFRVLKNDFHLSPFLSLFLSLFLYICLFFQNIPELVKLIVNSIILESHRTSIYVFATLDAISCISSVYQYIFVASQPAPFY